MSLRSARIDHVCDVNPRMPKSLSDEEIVSFLPMAAVSEDGVIDFEEERSAREVKKGYTYFERGDVLIAKITPCFENGKAARTSRLAKPAGFGSTEFHVLRPGREVDSSYLFHMVWNSRFREVGAANMTGSAGQKRVPADFLKRLEIPLPPLDEQRRIAAILDKADALRRKRKRALFLFSSLAQSIFHEKYESGNGTLSVPLAEICSKITDGTHQSPKWATDGVPFLFVSNIRNQEIDFDTNKFVSKQDYDALTKHTAIEAGDVLFTAVGSYGHSAVVPAGKDFVFQRHVAHLKPRREIVDSHFLSIALEAPAAKSQADREAKGIAQKTVTLASLKQIRIPLPSLEEQRKFRLAIDQIRREILATKKAADLDGKLFSSLQHRAFTGQL